MATQSLGSIGDKINLQIKQGSTFLVSPCTLTNPDETPVDLTGATIRGQIRRKALDTTVAADFVVSILDAVNGVFEFGLTDETTAGITAGEVITEAASKYVWDMELEDALGRVLPLYYGDVAVFREVTRA